MQRNTSWTVYDLSLPPGLSILPASSVLQRPAFKSPSPALSSWTVSCPSPLHFHVFCMLRAGILCAQPLELWVSTVPTLPPCPQLGPALSFNWVSRLPLSPNIPPGALGNIPWFAADCPAPRSLRCGQSGRRPGGRGLGRQRPGTLRSSLVQEWWVAQSSSGRQQAPTW